MSDGTSDGNLAESSDAPVHFNEDDIAYLLSVLRDYNRPQPISTQQLIDELRIRSARG